MLFKGLAFGRSKVNRAARIVEKRISKVLSQRSCRYFEVLEINDDGSIKLELKTPRAV